ncbi:hypothetical protein LJC68_10265, partial [Bacteroidales bacterium OttesenSCG-928-B11]|nr:hypothetical protein [Bacteroidales bacterium OttesenSCG-928-B11]
PIMLRDPDGRKIDPTSETEWNDQKQAIMNRKASIDSEINRLTSKAERKGWSEAKLNGRIGDLGERSSSLGQTLNTMQELEDCQKNTYKLRKVDKAGNFSLGKGDDAGKLIITYSSTASFVHEVTHGGQFHNKEVGLFGNGVFCAYDLTDEVRAYKAAFAYDPSYCGEDIYSSSQITTDWVRNLQDEKGEYPYSRLSAGPINDNRLFKPDRRRKQ